MTQPQMLRAPDQLVLPRDAMQSLPRSLPQARREGLEGLDHFYIIIQPHAGRSRAIGSFLSA
ncbi:MAG: hypothetical protein KQH53_18635 [Desulfarculaceae bacterium]|nr:hypothetical protein [Desulfarculaceae bacterium]